MKLARRRRRQTIGSSLKVNVYKLISRTVEEGVARGWQQAHKYTDEPKPDFIRQKIEDSVLSELCEIFIWPDVE